MEIETGANHSILSNQFDLFNMACNELRCVIATSQTKMMIDQVTMV